MKNRLLMLLLLLPLTGLQAATREVTLDVQGMTCPTCPLTIKMALGRVDGVQETQVNLERREARVSYDDTLTSPELLMQATANAGYPSSIKP